MAFPVRFWIFSKKENSTAIPSLNDAHRELSCSVKSDSGVLRPILEIGLAMSDNPSALNYCHIPQYSRYYRVTDWQWSGGLWLCSLEVDALASWRTQIGASTHYILRSSYESNPAAVDDFYPALARRPEFDTDTDTFGFESYADGTFVIGVAARDAESGPVTYYCLTRYQCEQLLRYMMPTASDWLSSFTAMTDSLYRSIYGPFDYIKSCRWFPLSYTPGNLAYIRFGNYVAQAAQTGDPEALGYLLPTNHRTWPILFKTLSLPSGWIQMEAKYKTPPYGNLFIIFNPFGIIELNPMDFFNASSVYLELLPDFISGDALLKIYKRTNEGDFLITERSSTISVNIPLSASNPNFLGVLANGTQAISSTIAALSSESVAGMAMSALAAASSAEMAAAAAIPTMSNSIGSLFGGPRAMDGVATLVFSSTVFAPEDNADHGKPLLATRQISAIPGYIKCAEGHTTVAGYAEEVQAINDYLTGGFFYE